MPLKPLVPQLISVAMTSFSAGLILTELWVQQAKSAVLATSPPHSQSTMPAPRSAAARRSALRKQALHGLSVQSHSNPPIAATHNAKSTSSPVGSTPSVTQPQEPLTTPTQTSIRVHILDASDLIVSMPEGGWIFVNNKPQAALAQHSLYQALATSSGVGVGGLAFGSVVTIEANHGAIWINDASGTRERARAYRGTITLVCTDNTLSVINTVDLETYLASVTGSEMYASWHPEALKAQAVAARSYAMKFIEQPLTDLFDIGSDENFQAYRGVEAETPQTIAAVEATRGQVLVKNNHILLAEYAANDAITASAHRGQGMSQSGAQARAKLGWSYLEILGDYYHNAGIAVLPEGFAQLR